MELLNNILLGLSFLIFLLSYKKDIKIKTCFNFGVLYLIVQILLNYYVRSNITKEIYVILRIISDYIIIKMVFKEKVNILDIFYITYATLLYKLSIIAIKEKIIVSIISLILSIIFKINQDKIYEISCKIINIWNEDSENSLTVRCVFIIFMNISIFIICKFLVK